MHTYQLYQQLAIASQTPESGFYLSELSTPARWPLLTFLPTAYEPGYAYPLLVFLHGRGGSERQLIPWMPALSQRNYVAIALRGPQMVRSGKCRRGAASVGLRSQPGYTWRLPASADGAIEEYVFEAIAQTQQRLHIHPQRIFLMGFCEGAEVAYRLALRYPERFGGLVVLNGALPSCRPLLRLPQARQLSVFIAHGIANAVLPLSAARQAASLLYTAGLNVQFRVYPTTHRLHPAMWQDANRWLMQLITARP
jgi:phospholipase/carboxylesterase